MTEMMGMVMIYAMALLIGVVAGLRAMTAPAGIAWTAFLGRLDLSGSLLAFMGYVATPWIFTLLAAGELVTDQLPSTPSRKVPVQFGARIVSGGLCGAAVGVAGGSMIGGLAAGVIGAVIGTLGGAAARAGLAQIVGKDRPAAIVEDVIAIGGAIMVAGALGHAATSLM
ncbi:MAG: hypothetical protein JWR77_1607 [Rhizorhabdus sp.]|nr:hypothetical protein [Rhizorhabdus sp.]